MTRDYKSMVESLEQEIIADVCTAHGVGIRDLTNGRSKSRHIVKARHHACRELAQAFGYSSNKIGEILGVSQRAARGALHRDEGAAR